MNKHYLFGILLLQIIFSYAQTINSGDIIEDPYVLEEVGPDFTYNIKSKTIYGDILSNFTEYEVSEVTIEDVDLSSPITISFTDTSAYSYSSITHVFKVQSHYMVALYSEDKDYNPRYVFKKIKANGDIDADFDELAIATSNEADYTLNTLLQDSTENIYVLLEQQNSDRYIENSILKKFDAQKGTFDTGFGKYEFNLSSSGNNRSAQLVIDPQNRPVISQEHQIEYISLLDQYKSWESTIIRLTTDGQLDTSFNGSGKKYFSPAAKATSQAYNISVVGFLADDKYLIAGLKGSTTSYPFVHVGVLTEDGVFDSTFNKGAIFNTNLTTFYGFASYFMDTQNRLLIAKAETGFKLIEGSTLTIPFAKSPSLHRYVIASDSSLVYDTTFANKGIASFSFYEEERASQWSILTEDQSSNDNYILTAGGLRYLLVASQDQIANGLFDLEETQKLEVYPNPASSIIHTEVGQLQIVDLTGNTVLSTKSTGQVDISGLGAGIYLISQNGKRTKLIIE